MGQSHELFDVKFFLATLSLCVQAAVHEGSALASVLPLQGDHSQDCQGGRVQVSSVILQILTTYSKDFLDWYVCKAPVHTLD